MLTLTRVGIAVFALAVILGPLYTVSEYSIAGNLLSELGAQHTKNNFIMIIDFLLLGAGIAIDGITSIKLALLPFILFGVAMAIVGIFPHKPIDAGLDYNSTFHSLHGMLASVAGTSITIGFIWQGILFRGSQKMVCFYLAAVALVFPLLMLKFPHLQGIIQRLMYVQILAWLWMNYPEKLLMKRSR